MKESAFAALGVLVVDDDEVQRRLAVGLLVNIGVGEVQEADSGNKALEVLRAGKSRLDVVLCDLKMPGMDGMRLLSLISEAGFSPSVIISSATEQNIMRSVELMARAQGFAVLGLLPKPASASAFRALLAKHRSVADRARRPAAVVIEAAEISEALNRGLIEPFFQPKVDLVTGRVSGAEALARWRHPALGVLLPGVFLGQIVQQDEMRRMTWDMIESATAWCARWCANGLDTTVSVNLSLAAMGDPTFPDRILHLVQEARLPADRLIFEITESSAMTDIAGSLETFTRLRMHRFGLSLDDFGTGFSSHQQLSRIPFSELKLDQTFVTGAAQQPHLRAVVESTVDMAKSLRLRIVGEGVESIEDWRFLQEIGVDMAQGYFISDALPAEEFQSWAEHWMAPR